MWIGKVIIHRLETGGSGITDPACLHRRGLARERQQSVAGRMPGQIDQDVDPIGGDFRGQCIVGHACDRDASA